MGSGWGYAQLCCSCLWVQPAAPVPGFAGPSVLNSSTLLIPCFSTCSHGSVCWGYSQHCYVALGCFVPWWALNSLKASLSVLAVQWMLSTTFHSRVSTSLENPCGTGPEMSLQTIVTLWAVSQMQIENPKN